MVKIGRIAYANCTPLFQALQNHFNCSSYIFIDGVPAVLNEMLRTGLLDVCPSSSIEYALYPDKYRIFPNLSISSNGPVKSVLLFSEIPIDMLDGKHIRLSSESATSVNLLKIIMTQHIGCSCSYSTTPPPHNSEQEENSKAFLLIGDAALKTSLTTTDRYVYDLGTLWKEWTGFPFVFALWICTETAAVTQRHELCLLNENLIQAKKYSNMELEKSAGNSDDTIWMGKDRLIEYWRNNIVYDLDTAYLDGLKLFYEKSFQLGLIPQIPELNFIAGLTY